MARGGKFLGVWVYKSSSIKNLRVPSTSTRDFTIATNLDIGSSYYSSYNKETTRAVGYK